MEELQREPGSKSELRSKFKKARTDFLAHSGALVRPQLESHIQRLMGDLAEPHQQVCLYRPLPDEPLFALAPERSFFYPRLEGDTLKFYRPRGPFETSRLGIEEPRPVESDPLDPQKPTIVFCPAVAVDIQGQRLGMGKGYYDRFFATQPLAQRVAVVYQVQVSTVPLHADSWDEPVDWIVTEKMILRTLRRSN